uniref:BTB domain-containing protein n=1 Tax=Eptatretus burgeri TaxID=7764 RepID=A0A8C4QMH2_EPTBU
MTMMMVGKRNGHEKETNEPNHESLTNKCPSYQSGARRLEVTNRIRDSSNIPETGTDEFEFCPRPPHSEGILSALDTFRLQGQLLTDVVLKANGCEFPCHRVVLAASSPYFRAMFEYQMQESQENYIEINDVNAGALELLLNFVYTGRIQISVENVQSLLETSSLFQLQSVLDASTRFLEGQLDVENVLGIHRFSIAHSLAGLTAQSRSFALDTFPAVSMQQEFLELQLNELQELLSSDDLHVESEEVVFEALMRWVHCAPKTRITHLSTVLATVRLPLLHPAYLVKAVEGDALIRGAPECFPLLQEARRHHVLGKEVESPRTQPRRFASCKEVVVVVGGCERMGGFNFPYMDCFEPLSGSWKSLLKLPEFAKSEYAVCALRNDILISGGRLNCNNVWLYKVHFNSWMRAAPLITGRWRHKMATLHGKVYAVGGYDGSQRLNSVEMYDSEINIWCTAAPLPLAVSSAAIAACCDRLYVVGGGTDDNTCSDQVQCYDPDSNTWTLRAPIPIARRCISAASLNGCVFIVGGLTSEILCYDPSDDTWETVLNNAEKQENCGMTVCNGNIFILGGKGEQGDATDAVFCFDPSSRQLNRVATMQRAVCYHGCVTINRNCQ